MDISNLIYFKAVVDTGSLSKAAQKLFLSQAALSLSIARLEADVGVPLFDRVGKKLVLNPAGETYYKSVNMVLSLLANSKKDAVSISHQRENTISYGSFTYCSFSTITPPYYALHPEVTFRLSQLDCENPLDLLMSGKIDIAMTCVPIDSPYVMCNHILTQRLYLTVPNTHPLTGMSYVDLSDLKDERFILMDHRSPLRSITDSIFDDAGFKPKSTYELTNSSLIPGLVNAGEGIALIPDTFTEHKGLRKINVSSTQCIHKIFFSWPKDPIPSDSCKAFINFIFERYKHFPKDSAYI